MEMICEFVVDAEVESIYRMMIGLIKLTEIIPDVIENEIIGDDRSMNM